jgi:TatD DNase family protein
VIDSHCHLADEAFIDDLDAVVTRAQDAGIQGVLCIVAAGDDAERTRANALTRLWPAARLATGVHPHSAAEFEGDAGRAAAAVEEAVCATSAVAIGEIGLDYHYDFAPREIQLAVFREQLRLASRLDLPVVIHTREAEADTFRLLEEEGAEDLRVIFHCFTGDRAMAARALGMGAYISLSGIVTFPRAEELRAVAREVPGDRLLVETDSPYLAPVPHRGGRNEPAWVARTVERVAEVRGESPTEVAASTTRTFHAVLASRTDENH